MFDAKASEGLADDGVCYVVEGADSRWVEPFERGTHGSEQEQTHEGEVGVGVWRHLGEQFLPSLLVGVANGDGRGPNSRGSGMEDRDMGRGVCAVFEEGPEMGSDVTAEPIGRGSIGVEAG